MRRVVSVSSPQFEMLNQRGRESLPYCQRAILYDVPHIAYRSARYTPAGVSGTCSPANAKQSAFPVAPGGAMPPVEVCTKQDYAVLIVVGVAWNTEY